MHLCRDCFAINDTFAEQRSAELEQTTLLGTPILPSYSMSGMLCSIIYTIDIIILCIICIKCVPMHNSDSEFIMCNNDGQFCNNENKKIGLIFVCKDFTKHLQRMCYWICKRCPNNLGASTATPCIFTLELFVC